MGDIYNGTERSYQLRITETVDGQTSSYIFAPSIIDAFDSYSQITSVEYLALSQVEFEDRVNAYYDYVNSHTTPPMNLPNDLHSLPERNNASCAGTIGPDILVSPSNLEFGNVKVGESSVGSYTLTGFNLLGDINVSVPLVSSYTISLNNDSGFTNSLQISKDTSNEVNTTIYVKFHPTDTQSYTDSITNASASADTEYVTLAGVGQSASITVTPASLLFGEVTAGDDLIKKYVISANNLSENINIANSSGFTLSKTLGGTYSASLIVARDGNGNVSETDIYVRFAPTAPTDYIGNIQNKSGTIIENVGVVGKGVAVNTPNIIVEPNNIDFEDVFINKAFPELIKSAVVSGNYLTDDISVSIASPGFRHSLSPTSNFTTSNLTISPTNGVVGNTTIYVEFAPSSPNPYNGTLSFTSNGAASKVVALQGQGKNGTLEVTPSSIDFGYVKAGEMSPEQIIYITGDGLGSTVHLESPVGFFMSKTSGGTSWANSIDVLVPNGTLNNYPVYIRFGYSSEDDFSGIITLNSFASDSAQVSVSASTVIPVESTISVSFNNGATYSHVEDSDILQAQYLTSDVTISTDISVEHSGGGVTLYVTNISHSSCPDYGALDLVPSTLPWELDLAEHGTATLYLGSGVGTAGTYSCDVTVNTAYPYNGSSTPLEEITFTVEIEVTP